MDFDRFFMTKQAQWLLDMIFSSGYLANSVFFYCLNRNINQSNMWQKLNHLDALLLREARTQLLNAVQVVSAAPRSYQQNSTDPHIDWLAWDENTSSFISKEFGPKENIKVLLDIRQFVISIAGPGHAEHLVLSGMTYPMAFGWMQIKLETFGLDGSLFSDKADYEIEDPLGPADELVVTDQYIFDQMALYFSNAAVALRALRHQLPMPGVILTDPSNIHMKLIPTGSSRIAALGFSPGDSVFPEPYFFIQVHEAAVPESVKEDVDGFWNIKNWTGPVLPIDDIMTTDHEKEYQKVMDFFKNNLRKLV